MPLVFDHRRSGRSWLGPPGRDVSRLKHFARSGRDLGGETALRLACDSAVSPTSPGCARRLRGASGTRGRPQWTPRESHRPTRRRAAFFAGISGLVKLVGVGEKFGRSCSLVVRFRFVLARLNGVRFESPTIEARNRAGLRRQFALVKSCAFHGVARIVERGARICSSTPVRTAAANRAGWCGSPRRPSGRIQHLCGSSSSISRQTC